MINTMIQMWRVKQTYKKTRAALMNLSDRDLKDLGLTRNVVDDVAYSAAYGK
jgi:uncharacterized protein YjiS (DUF1127 family)